MSLIWRIKALVLLLLLVIEPKIAITHKVNQKTIVIPIEFKSINPNEYSNDYNLRNL